MKLLVKENTNGKYDKLQLQSQMHTFIYLFLFLFLTLINATDPFAIPQPSLQYPSNCTTNQTQMVKTAILACQMSSISNSSVCIRDYINKNSSNQHWNAFVKNIDSNVDTVAFWFMDNCVVQLTAFGTMVRSYLVWNTDAPGKNTTGLELQKRKSQLNKENLLQQQGIDKNVVKEDLRTEHMNTNQLTSDNALQLSATDCPSWKNSTITQILNVCEFPSVQHSANCIMARIRVQIGDYWNAYVSTSQSSPSDVANYYIQCTISKSAFGTNNRYIKVWRTDSIVNI